MAQTFDIRFARSAGLAAMLEAPSNSFQWTGNGSLSIDAQGISVAVQRGLLSLLSRNRTRRIPSASLSQVFREGDALRVEFATADATRASLKFWARDREAAAQIVRLMPTLRTIELEEKSGNGHFRLNWRGLLLSGAVLATVLFGVLALRGNRTNDSPVESQVPPNPSSLAAASADGVETPGAAPSSSGSAISAKLPGDGDLHWRPARAREIVVPVYPNGRSSSLQTLDPVGLSPGAANVPDALASGANAAPLDSRTLASLPIIFTVNVSSDGVLPLVAGMAGYEAAHREIASFRAESGQGKWWEMTVRIHNDPAFDDPALWPLRDAELAASRAARTFDDDFARMLTARVYQFAD